MSKDKKFSVILSLVIFMTGAFFCLACDDPSLTLDEADECSTNADCDNGKLCIDGVCKPGGVVDGDAATDGDDESEPDGDADLKPDGDDDSLTDGDQEGAVTSCERDGGFCGDQDGICPMGARKAADGKGCESGLCCFPLDEIDCYRDGGYCAPVVPGSSAGGFCREGFHPTLESDNECVLFDEWCCIPDVPVCVTEGNWGSRIDSNENNDHCCAGLGEIADNVPDGDGNCRDTQEIAEGFICAFCGNGLCGPGENYCNCPDDCAAPGLCQSDDDCPPPECFEIGDWPLFWSCVECVYTCDTSTHDCFCDENVFEEWTCDHRSGMCVPPVPVICESEGTGTCLPPGTDDCPEGKTRNRDPLGCQGMYGEPTCCLDADCLDEGGYCTIWPGECDSGYAAVSGHMGCPGGDSAMCCIPNEPACTPLGEIGIMPDGYCCEGLDEAPYAEISSEGDCLFPDCSCFVCIVKGDGFCDERSLENECNSEDCEGPIPECLSDSDCPRPHCVGFSGLPNCAQYSYSCVEGECAENETIMEDMYCDERSGQCRPFEQTACQEQGGYCTYYQEGCAEGYVPSQDDEQLGCPGGRSALCCLPETQECVSLGGIGYMFTDDECCTGLTPTVLAEVDENGECIYYDCSCFICLDIGDEFCDEDIGENECNSDDCEEEPPDCVDDSDCPDSWCDNLPTSMARCIQISYGCIQGVCEEFESTFENSYCDTESSYCTPIEEPACLEHGGYCTYFFDGCEEGYSPSQDPNQLGCPGGRSALCCLSDAVNPCEEQGGVCLPDMPGSTCPDGFHGDVSISCGVADTFCCMPDSECVLAGGYCNSPDSDCREGYEPASGHMGCGSDESAGICCLPRQQTECEERDGLCIFWQSPCPDGYIEANENLGCTRSGHCCLPCIGEGERGSMFDDDVCCPGLARISNATPWEHGMCIATPDGSFFCAYCEDGECGPGENICNCPEDCTPVIECEADRDCLDKDWEVDCYGHWDCVEGACVENCGEPCGNGECEPDEGEAINTCYSDCRIQCRTDADCLGRDWPVYCYGHWDCVQSYCVARCGLPCGNGVCESNKGEEEANCHDCHVTPECNTDEECGGSYCYMENDGCHQIVNSCDNGVCMGAGLYSPYGICDESTGECVEQTPSCDSLGGYCASWMSGCPISFHPENASCGDMICAGGCICCVPN